MHRLMTAGLWVLGLAVGGAGPALAQEGWARDWWEQATPASVQEWLDRGADLHARDVGGGTPLHWADADSTGGEKSVHMLSFFFVR